MNDVLQVIINGLTYAGQTPHIIINYALIILLVIPFLLFDNRSPSKESRAWLGCLVIAVIIQVAVWFAARALGISAVGVSLVWCIMVGYLLIDDSNGKLGRAGSRRGFVLIALGAGCGGIVYYMVAFPAITTIAHLVAVAIGVGLFYLMRLIARRNESQVC
jgi:hypothetical protein